MLRGWWRWLNGASASSAAAEQQDTFAHLRLNKSRNNIPPVTDPTHVSYLQDMDTILNRDIHFAKVPVVVDSGQATGEIMLCGFYKSAEVPHLQSEYAITHVLNMANSDCGPNRQREHEQYGVEYLGISADDYESYDIMAHWDEVKDFIDNFLNNAKKSTDKNGGDDGQDVLKTPRLLINCMAGINRSGAMAVAVVAYLENKTLLQAVEQVHRLKGPILTNIGFRQRLVAWAQKENYL
jgi:hypothetical protein